jgi:hypothetical protein
MSFSQSTALDRGPKAAAIWTESDTGSNEISTKYFRALDKVGLRGEIRIEKVD